MRTYPAGDDDFWRVLLQSVPITNTDKGFERLIDATLSLWKQGLRVSFGPHYAMQAREYKQLLLPPYQFEKPRHWLEIKSPAGLITKAAQDMITAGSYGLALGGEVRQVQQEHYHPKTLGLWTFIGFQDHKTDKGSPRKRRSPLGFMSIRFRTNTTAYSWST